MEFLLGGKKEQVSGGRVVDKGGRLPCSEAVTSSSDCFCFRRPALIFSLMPLSSATSQERTTFRV